MPIKGEIYMNIRYRKAKIDDIPKLNPLLSQLSETMANPAEMARKMEKLDRNEDCFLLVAEDTENGALCGSLLVENVVTDKAYRGRGIGRGMFEFIENWGREKECHYCILVSGMNRTGAHKFYDAIGYSEVKGFKKYL